MGNLPDLLFPYRGDDGCVSAHPSRQRQAHEAQLHQLQERFIGIGALAREANRAHQRIAEEAEQRQRKQDGKKEANDLPYPPGTSGLDYLPETGEHPDFAGTPLELEVQFAFGHPWMGYVGDDGNLCARGGVEKSTESDDGCQYSQTVPPDLIHVQRARAVLAAEARKLEVGRDHEKVIFSRHRLVVSGSGHGRLIAGVQLHGFARQDIEMGDDYMVVVLYIDRGERLGGGIGLHFQWAKRPQRQSATDGKEQNQREFRLHGQTVLSHAEAARLTRRFCYPSNVAPASPTLRLVVA